MKCPWRWRSTGGYGQKISLDQRGWLRLQVFKRRAQGHGAEARLSISARVAKRLKKPHALATVIPSLWDAVYRETAAALEKKCSAELSYCYASAAENTALVDCSFSFAKKGLCAYRRALKGDYAWMRSASARHVEIHGGVLTHELLRETRLELHLPFLHRQARATGLEPLAPMEVTSDENGRLLVYQVDEPHRVACHELVSGRAGPNRRTSGGAKQLDPQLYAHLFGPAAGPVRAGSR